MLNLGGAVDWPSRLGRGVDDWAPNWGVLLIVAAQVGRAVALSLAVRPRPMKRGWRFIGEGAEHWGGFSKQPFLEGQAVRLRSFFCVS